MFRTGNKGFYDFIKKHAIPFITAVAVIISSGESAFAYTSREIENNVVTQLNRSTSSFLVGIQQQESLVFDNDIVQLNQSDNLEISVTAKMEIGSPVLAFTQKMVIEKRPQSGKIEYDCHLPMGYQLVEDYEYSEDRYDRFDCGDIYVLNERGEVVEVVSVDSVQDSYGNEIKVDISIQENVITYDIGGNTFLGESNTVILTSTSHPNYSKTRYMNSAAIKSERDRYTGSNFDYAVSGIVLLGISRINGTIGATYTIVSVSCSIYEAWQYSKWNSFYIHSINYPKDKYLKVTTTWHYHSGKRCYYPASCSFGWTRYK